MQCANRIYLHGNPDRYQQRLYTVHSMFRSKNRANICRFLIGVLAPRFLPDRNWPIVRTFEFHIARRKSSNDDDDRATLLLPLLSKKSFGQEEGRSSNIRPRPRAPLENGLLLQRRRRRPIHTRVCVRLLLLCSTHRACQCPGSSSLFSRLLQQQIRVRLLLLPPLFWLLPVFDLAQILHTAIGRA